MRYFAVEFEWKTRPRFRKGRLKRETVTIAANDVAEMLALASAEGKRRYPRHKWSAVSWQELRVSA